MLTKTIKGQPESFSQNGNAPFIDMPSRVILSSNPFYPAIDRLEGKLAQVIELKELFHDLIECMQQERDHELELQYYCLYLAEKFGYLREMVEAKRVMSEIQVVGFNLAMMLKEFNLYRNGRLPYCLGEIDHRGILLIRNDYFFGQLTKEFKQAAPF